MLESSLTTKDIVTILKACKMNNVRAFAFGSLEITFGSEEPTINHKAPPIAETEEIVQLAFEKEKLAARKDTIEDLLLEDPLTYEERLIADAFEDEDSDEEI